MPEQIELRPCPWCGADAEFQQHHSKLWMIVTGCDCDIMAGFPRKQEVAAWWNARRVDTVANLTAECRAHAEQHAADEAEIATLSAEIEKMGDERIALQEHLENRLAEITRLENAVYRERESRVYYQNIVYAVCNRIDSWQSVPATSGRTVCCGTAAEPCREVQDCVEAMGAQIKRLKKELCIQKGNEMETYADCLRRIVGVLDAGGTKSEVGAEILRIACAIDETERDADPPLVVIENLPTLGVSSKYDLTAMLRLSGKEYARLMEVIGGMVAQVSQERGCPTTNA